MKNARLSDISRKNMSGYVSGWLDSNYVATGKVLFYSKSESKWIEPKVPTIQKPELQIDKELIDTCTWEAEAD